MNQKLAKSIESHLYVLIEEIGERPGASDNDHRTAGYIAETFDQAGWEVEEQRFDCPQWTHHQTHFTLNGDTLEAAANAYSPPCDVQAPSVASSTLAELRMADIHSKMAILTGDLVPAPLSPKAWFLLSEKEAEIIRLLEEKQPAAVLTVQNHRGGLERLIEDWEFKIPSATITPAAALTLLQNPEEEAHLLIDSEQEPGYSANIVARSPARPSTVVIMAHFDTKFDTPGALDNGSGVAALLALAQNLNAADYAFGLEFVAFTNEEYLPLGDDEYLRRREQKLDDIVLAINMDGIGQYFAANSIATFGVSEELEAALRAITPAYPGLVWTDPWPESNHSTFSMRGVPAAAFTSTGRVELAHWPDDDLRWLNPARIADVAGLVVNILGRIAEL